MSIHHGERSRLEDRRNHNPVHDELISGPDDPRLVNRDPPERLSSAKQRGWWPYRRQ